MSEHSGQHLLFPSRHFGTYWPAGQNVPKWRLRNKNLLAKMSHNDGSDLNTTGQNVPNWRLGKMNNRQNLTPLPKRVDFAHKSKTFLKTDSTSRRRNSNEGSVWRFRNSKKIFELFYGQKTFKKRLLATVASYWRLRVNINFFLICQLENWLLSFLFYQNCETLVLTHQRYIQSGV